MVCGYLIPFRRGVSSWLHILNRPASSVLEMNGEPFPAEVLSLTHRKRTVTKWCLCRGEKSYADP